MKNTIITKKEELELILRELDESAIELLRLQLAYKDLKGNNVPQHQWLHKVFN
ncbi:MAG: hypothetical protein JXR07_04610 [Reichenbachiella sp.]